VDTNRTHHSDMDAAELTQEIAGLPGWLTQEEAVALFELARACTGRGAIVEIGSWKGKSTICLALGSKHGARVPVYAIDPHSPQTFGEFKRNVERAGVGDLVTPVRGRSQTVVETFEEPIELLWIDGSHKYHLVKEDFEKWVPKVVEGGIVAMHDTTLMEGPRRVATAYIIRSRSFSGVRFVVGGTTIGRKVAQNTLRDRLRAEYVLAVKTVFGMVSAVLIRKRHLLPRPLEAFGRRIIQLIQ
jgi:predicted O-methyltransferase YrrM